MNRTVNLANRIPILTTLPSEYLGKPEDLFRGGVLEDTF